MIVNEHNLKKEARRAYIVHTAKCCFEERGLHGVSMDYISRKTQLSFGQLYRLFGGKDNLIECVASEVLKNRVESVTEPTIQKSFDEMLIAPIAVSESILFMEILAEASRNQRLRDLVIDAEVLYIATLKKQISCICNHLDDDQLSLMSEFMIRFSEGGIFRQRFLLSLPEMPDVNFMYKGVFSCLVGGVISTSGR